MPKSRSGADPEQQEWQVNKHDFQGWERGHSGRELPLRVKGKREQRKLQKQKWGEKRP